MRTPTAAGASKRRWRVTVGRPRGARPRPDASTKKPVVLEMKSPCIVWRTSCARGATTPMPREILPSGGRLVARVEKRRSGWPHAPVDTDRGGAIDSGSAGKTTRSVATGLTRGLDRPSGAQRRELGIVVRWDGQSHERSNSGSLTCLYRRHEELAAPGTVRCKDLYTDTRKRGVLNNFGHRAMAQARYSMGGL